MARMIRLHEVAYPGLRSWLTQGLSTVHTKDPVWRAFLEHSKLSDEDARDAIGRDSDPLVFVEKSRWGGSYQPSKPTTIYLATHLVKDFEANPSDAGQLQRVESTVLHEIVHWAWGRRGEAERIGNVLVDKGAHFERDAYGDASTLEPPRALGADPPLGELSREYESRGDPGAVGFDRNGGWSYGSYQLASRQGQVGAFLGFLSRNSSFRPFAARLEGAGGESAAQRGSLRFKDVWKELAIDERFGEAQHEYIRTTHYERFVAKLTGKEIDIRQRSRALREVAWSVGVQHGTTGGIPIFQKPWLSLGAPARLDDARYIDAIYDERSRVDVYFKKSTLEVRRSVKRRFEKERRAALEMLSAA